MKLGGFVLKKGKKKALGAPAGFLAAVHSAPQESDKVFVTDFDPNAPAPLAEDGQKPLVIPLLGTNAWAGGPNDPNETLRGDKIGTSNSEIVTSEASVDEQAAVQILAETQAAKTQSCNAQQRDLVIPVSEGREKKRAELFQDGEMRPKNDQKKPILQQNAVPGLDELQDVTDKYRHDVALRPEAPDVHSEIYESVPVEAFGAALLRGMGWKGDVDPDDVGVAPQPRHKLLGLGATKRPSLPGDKKKRKKRKVDTQDKDKARRSGFNKDRPREDRIEDKERSSRRSSRSVDRDRRYSQSRSERRKQSHSRSQDRDHGRGRDRNRRRGRDREDHRDRGRDRDHERGSRSHSHSRSDRHSCRR